MSKLEQRITVTAVTLPFVGFIVAIVLLWGGMVDALDLGLFALMYFITAMGITVGYHRLFTHRSFEAKKPVRMFLAIAGSMSVQGAPIHWVADHRKHHDFADEEGDPHSPHTHGKPGWHGIVAGWWHSHMGWLFSRDERASASRYARDLKNDPTMVWVDKHFFSWILLGLAIPAVLGFAISGGELGAAATGLLWGGFVRIFIQHHATWSVNSICHMYGKQPFEIEDQSTNNWAVAIVSMGEGWHHNHHAFPTSAKHGLVGRQFDPSYLLIKGLEKTGLAWNLRQPTEEQVARKLKPDFQNKKIKLDMPSHASDPDTAAGAAKVGATADARGISARAESPRGDAPTGATSEREAIAAGYDAVS
ncbi:MAG: acyl-CoA desaturase [Solirubrobacterales bacterium]